MAKVKLLDPGNEAYFEEICLGIADDFIDYSLNTLAGPQTGSVPYVTRVAEILTKRTGRKIEAVFVEKCTDGTKNFYIKDEDKHHIANRRVGLLEDVTTTKIDGSLRRVVLVIEEAGGNIIVATALWNRGRVTKEDLGVKEFLPQIDIPIDTYTPESDDCVGDCPGCKDKIRYHGELGHGKNMPKDHPLAPI